ncbi:MAG TPA: hypothetical protein VE869_04015 [Gemmatimonas sp.]|nr:hypothetical protein [Gemmatimonas sp.]
MQQELIMLGSAVLVGGASGADASIWGMYKDAAHEGFAWPRFWRSVIIGATAALLIQLVLQLPLPRPSAILLLFGLAYAAERGVVETWKTFFRDEDQSKYAIPMQFALRGIPVQQRGARVTAGVGYIATILLAGYLLSRFDVGTPTLLRAAGGGFIVGLVIAVGGAWKDAPIEGFETLKFFRSPVLTTAFSILLFPIGESVLLAATAAIGYERAASENYKTFFFPSRPRGKFAGKPVTHPEMLRNRRKFVPAYLAIRVGLAWVLAATFMSPVR